MTSDAELLRRYIQEGSHDAFAELVRRHINLVYSVALRQVNGDTHLAADATQLVFADLARKAKSLPDRHVLSGWFFTSARYAAANLVRSERRRQTREQEAQLMSDLSQNDPAAQLDWQRVRPVLDDVIDELKDDDREAILLRFFEGHDYATIGAKLTLSDNTARMRVERALDKLRTGLERRGVTSTSAALAAVLAQPATVAAPAGLAAAVTGVALAGGGIGAGVGAGTASAVLGSFGMAKLQLGVGGVLAAAALSGIAVQHSRNEALRNEIAALQRDNAALTQLRRENNRLLGLAAEATDLRQDDHAFARLQEEAAGLKSRLQQLARSAEARANAAVQVFDLSTVDVQPTPRFQARPQYPFAMRTAGITAEVLVDFIVDANGDVKNARAIRSTQRAPQLHANGGAAPTGITGSGSRQEDTPFVVAAPATGGAASMNHGNNAARERASPDFEAAAVDAVTKWKFKPGGKGGRNVATHIQVPIVFTISHDEEQTSSGPLRVTRETSSGN